MFEYKKQLELLKNTIETSKEYDFLRTNERLQNNIVMLGLGGSYAYGTYVETSDIDVRGIAKNTREEILLGLDFEQYMDNVTDTTLYSTKKIVQLLAKNNPNTMEFLGLTEDQIFVTSPIWKLIQENKDLFLSKLCVYTFGGYANQQLRRLETKSARAGGQAQKEGYIYNTIQHAEYVFKDRYTDLPEDAISLYIDESSKEGMEKELYVDINVTHYPLRDFVSLMSDYGQVVRSYDKVSKRNENAISHGKLGKHMMHLIRLYHMAFDILEDGVIQTYREKDHDFLMSIRDGKYLTEDLQVVPEFYTILTEYEDKLELLAKTSQLPDKPDQKKVNDLLIKINEIILAENT